MRTPDEVRVETRRDGGLAHVRLLDGARNNALGPELVAQLRAALHESAGSSAIVLSAAGRNFCAGGDHAELAALSREDFERYLASLVALFADLAALPAPIVMCVQRAVVGGGLELVLLADLVVATDDAWFQLPQVALGGRVGSYSYRALVARTGLSVARRMVLLGDRLDADAALEHGLVDDLVNHAELVDRGIQLATRLAGQPAKALFRSRAAFAELIGAADLLSAEVRSRADDPHRRR